MRKIIALTVFLALSINAHALEKPTHETLNEKVAVMLGINDYLKLRLGFSEGLGTVLNNKKIIEWIRYGGKAEDEPMYTRSMNHFHNPLRTWDSAGLKGTFQSAVLWAQEQGFFGSLWGGNFSWKAAREYYYIALTGRDFSGTLVVYTQSEKEKYFDMKRKIK